MQENQDQQKQIELGCRVKDTVTGFTGIATGRYEKITGQVSYGVEVAHNFTGAGKGKSEHEERWFDAERVEYVDDGIIQRGSIGTEALTPDPPFNAMSDDDDLGPRSEAFPEPDELSSLERDGDKAVEAMAEERHSDR